jgi:hypothetical protein
VAQIRLVQESQNLRALGLYLRLGFRVVAPLLELERPVATPLVAPDVPGGITLRAATDDDRSRIVTRDARAFGAPRGQSVDLYRRHGSVLVAERGRNLLGYGLAIGFEEVGYLGSAAADDADALLALLGAAAAELSARGLVVRTLVPAADRGLVDSLLGLGFRVFRACHYMVRGGGTAPPPNYVLMNGDMM